MDQKERIEQVIFRIKFPAKRKKELQKYLTRFGNFQWTKGDTITIEYPLIGTYKNCVKQLDTILELLDKPGKLISVDTEELNYSKCLIQEVFLKMEEIQSKLTRKRGV